MVFAPQETSLPGTPMQTGPLWPGQEENPERFEGARRKAKASERRSFLHTAPLHNNRYGIDFRYKTRYKVRMMPSWSIRGNRCIKECILCRIEIKIERKDTRSILYFCVESRRRTICNKRMSPFNSLCLTCYI